MIKSEVNPSVFQQLDIRVGSIKEVNDFPKAKIPAFKIHVDFGDLGLLKTSAQLTENYTKEMLVNKKVIAVVNFPPKQIADFMSECLILGILDPEKGTVLIQPEQEVNNGSKIA